MNPFYGLVVALLIGGCSASPLGSNAVAMRSGSGMCQGDIQKLTGTEIEKLIVSARVRYAGDAGVCPGSLWITSNWELDFRTNGLVLIHYDRGGRTGRYAISGDQLCITKDSAPDCHRFYRDKQGRIYLADAEMPASIPAMVTIHR